MAASTSAPDQKTITQMKDEIYDGLSKLSRKRVDLQDIIDLDVIPGNDPPILLKVINMLLTERLFRLQDNNSWVVLKREDAEKYHSLNADEALIYSHIESSGREGMWIKTIKARTNLHVSVINKSIKTLDSRRLIKQIRSVKFPTRQYYMLYYLLPSEDVTGGPWFTDNELDREFVDVLCSQIERFVAGRSFRKVSSGGAGKGKGKDGDNSKVVSREKGLVHYPPEYKGYPTLHEIMSWVSDSGFTETVLSESNVEQLMDLLYYDRKVEKVLGGSAYRSLRQQPPTTASDVTKALDDDVGRSNGLTEAPCGRCPVFHLCEEGGPVSASNCEYFADWLSI